MGYIVAFWLGVGACYAFVHYSTHPEDRAALLSRIKGLFGKDGT